MLVVLQALLALIGLKDDVVHIHLCYRVRRSRSCETAWEANI